MPELVQENKEPQDTSVLHTPSSAAAITASQPSSSISTVDSDDEPAILVSRSHLLSCLFTAWWPLLRRHTIASRVISLPDEFVAYLQEDGMKLPEKMAPARAYRDALDDSDSEWSDEEAEQEGRDGEQRVGDDEHDSDTDNTAASVEPASFFPSVVSAIDTAIAELGGCVHPRLDWRSPSDASWITCDKTTRCHSAADVILLLKASDTIAHELSHPFAHTTADLDSQPSAYRPSLVLRRWSNLYPSSRFRCFVWSYRLLAISQHDANYYQHLTSPTHRQRTVAAIRRFVDEEVVERLAAEGEGRVLDLYVDGDERVWLVDVKPWSTRTDPALFTWDELLDMAADEDGAEDGDSGEEGDDECEYRVVESGGDNTYMLRVARKSLGRLPHADGIDLSDAAGIERFAEAMDKLH